MEIFETAPVIEELISIIETDLYAFYTKLEALRHDRTNPNYRTVVKILRAGSPLG